MKYSKEERIELGRKIHESGLSNLKAGKLFALSEESARRYRILYEQSQGIEHTSSYGRKEEKITVSPITPGEPLSSSEDYSSMSKEELIGELMKSKIREARLKKGYLVKGVGADKEYILLDSRNIK